MRQPKEPKTFKYPRLYARIVEDGSECEQRIRIIYPNGDAEWEDMTHFCLWHDPCWNKTYHNKKLSQDGNEAVSYMKQYDAKSYRYKTVFLGEIK